MKLKIKVSGRIRLEDELNEEQLLNIVALLDYKKRIKVEINR